MRKGFRTDVVRTYGYGGSRTDVRGISYGRTGDLVRISYGRRTDFWRFVRIPPLWEGVVVVFSKDATFLEADCCRSMRVSPRTITSVYTGNDRTGPC